jgi:hypothetical protein
MARQKRKRRRELIGTFVVLLGLNGGGLGGFVQSPSRLLAFREAMADIRSVGDVAAMVAKYQVALDKIATRSNQIDPATEAMGGEGKTTGQRNQKLQNAFGKQFKAPEPAVAPTSDQAPAKKASADSFSIN